MVERIPHARKQQLLPVILSADEIVRFFAAVPSLKHRTALMAAYAAGLRVSEVVRLRVGDIDSDRMLFRVEQGKGQRDRYVMLSAQLLVMLRAFGRNTGCSRAETRDARSTQAHSTGRAGMLARQQSSASP
jgi:integrase/recombinase XerD